MRIDKNHLYHGAALLQIAEDSHFTAINPIWLKKGVARNAYCINDKVAVYLKYASNPTPAYDEFVFNFDRDHLAELEEIARLVPKIFLALVCVSARHICSLPYDDLLELVRGRRTRKEAPEDTYAVLVTAAEGRSFRAYMNVPGVKKTKFGELTISRNNFPRTLFA